ncbi:MAG: biotin transporter BioY [Bacteroidetes bacterium]|nr:biotin transporter BioY [Bacteroidota bacterium]MDA0904376.1 biotin transporter BioY [Bacteroidota bacterium]MDA1243051.1 biotin transporter BioY [Bacteroidota bacterium]
MGRWSLVLASCMGAIVMGLASPHVWHLEGAIPITPQSLVILLWAVLWGWKVGTLAVLLYLLAGGIGLPVFAGGSHGWVHFTGSTAGFLWAFLIASLVVGALAERAKRFRYGTAALLMLLGHGILLVLGLAWQRGIMPVEASWTETVKGLMPAVFVKSALGTLLVVFVGRLLERRSPSQDGVD